MSFLGTATGRQLIATGAFNATGAALVAGLAGNVANVTASATRLATQIDRTVSPICLRRTLRSPSRPQECRPCPSCTLASMPWQDCQVGLRRILSSALNCRKGWMLGAILYNEGKM